MFVKAIKPNNCPFFLPLALVLAFSTASIFSCQTVDLFERVVSIPRQEWKSDYKPQFHFNISDTQSNYAIFVVLRHNEKYEFNNIWISLTYQLEGQPAVTGKYELPLATNDKWIGTAMDDLYEHRVLITPPKTGLSLKPGAYTFTIGHIMRKDPLEHILNVGLRIEKIPQ